MEIPKCQGNGYNADRNCKRKPRSPEKARKRIPA